jgi:hypothetical protein
MKLGKVVQRKGAEVTTRWHGGGHLGRRVRSSLPGCGRAAASGSEQGAWKVGQRREEDHVVESRAEDGAISTQA